MRRAEELREILKTQKRSITPDPSFKTVGGTALTGATTGVVLGSAILGAPLTIGVVGAVTGGYLATRNDQTGEVARTVGDATNSTIKKAQEVDERFDITGKTKNAVTTVYSSVVDAEKRYDLSGKVKATASVIGETAKVGVAYASKMDAEYDLTGKTKTIARVGWEGVTSGAKRAAEINRQYQISERVHGAMMNGLGFLSDATGIGASGEEGGSA